ncbi:hypothetical protein [Paraburkholderia sp. BL10I2N1]|uniref:hypothetical protein n=1 Tax=Paraburkholderia sp. BL10I2N1 TaxID=1938796 RepID=UPI0010604F51|nr:hypothetical protein [Paraburkholderia sp. BL10I2N1]
MFIQESDAAGATEPTGPSLTHGCSTARLAFAQARIPGFLRSRVLRPDAFTPDIPKTLQNPANLHPIPDANLPSRDIAHHGAAQLRIVRNPCLPRLQAAG